MQEFKVGDWVRWEEMSKTKVFKIDYYDGERYHLKNEIHWVHPNKLTIWEPKPEEWCWFFDNPEYPNLRKFTEFDNGYFLASDGIYYLNCEPFTGKLPSFVKSEK